jgi:hypothetical protein
VAPLSIVVQDEGDKNMGENLFLINLLKEKKAKPKKKKKTKKLQ